MSILWACFALPQLPLESLFRHRSDEDASVDSAARSSFPEAPRTTQGNPSANDLQIVHDGAAQRARIVCVDAAAYAAGIRTGMPLAQAQALRSDLIAHRRQPDAEAGQLETLAALAYAFSSQVAIEPPDAVLLEIGASRSLFGDWPRIEAALRSHLTALGHRHVLAAAPTPAAARVLATLADGYAVLQQDQLTRVLARVPVQGARLSPAHTDALLQLGTRTLRDVRALPRAGLVRRFGGELLRALDHLHGDEPDVRTLYRPPDRFERTLAFDYGIEQQGALQFPLQRLTREFAAFLQGRDGGVLRFFLRFEHDPHEQAAAATNDSTQENARHDHSTRTHGTRVGSAQNRSTLLEVGLRKPGRDADALFEAARSQLERLALPAPAHALSLIAEELPPFAPELRDLFDTSSRGNLDFDGLLERLRARLGPAAIRPLALHADYRPEHAWRVAEPDAAYSSSVSQPARPLWLLPRPTPFRGRIVRLLETPERIETGWWDGDDVRRDYVIAELDSGQHAWLFCPAGDDTTRTDGWMLHGWFA